MSYHVLVIALVTSSVPLYQASKLPPALISHAHGARQQKPSFNPPQSHLILGFKNRIKDTWNYPMPLSHIWLILTRLSSTLSLQRFVLRLARHIGIVRMTRPLVLSH